MSWGAALGGIGSIAGIGVGVYQDLERKRQERRARDRAKDEIRKAEMANAVGISSGISPALAQRVGQSVGIPQSVVEGAQTWIPSLASSNAALFERERIRRNQIMEVQSGGPRRVLTSSMPFTPPEPELAAPDARYYSRTFPPAAAGRPLFNCFGA